MGSSINNTVTETLSRISKVQDALEAAKQETDYTSKVKASNSVKEHLKHLHDLLTRGSSTDSNDSSVSQEDKSERREKRAKRDLEGRIANPSWDLNRGRASEKEIQARGRQGTQDPSKVWNKGGREGSASRRRPRNQRQRGKHFLRVLQDGPRGRFPRRQCFLRYR